jgi:hypothetical protein
MRKGSSFEMGSFSGLPVGFDREPADHRSLRAMLQDPANQDVFSAHRPSPWPFVGGMIAATALITALVVAFGS